MATFRPALSGSSPVNVPSVVNLTQSAATAAITNAGLVVGTITTASSATVPAGSVISQNPAAGTSVATGSGVSLVLSSGPSAGLAVDNVLFSDGLGTRTLTGFNTSVPGDLLLAFVGADGPSGGGQTATVSGAGLTWTLVRRVNTQAGTSEIWKATAAGALSNTSITSTLSSGSYRQSLTVVAFSGASGTGATGAGNATTGAPTVSLVTTQPGSFVYGVGNDWDHATARTLASGQAMVHQWVDSATGDTYWVQNRTAPVAAAGSTALLNDTAPTTDRWNFASVEVLAGPGAPAVVVPSVVNLTQSAATTGITNAGLVVGTVTTASSATVPSGSVISQSPTAGTSVASGSAVNLVVSTGPQLVVVPSAVNLTQAAATSAITDAGLVVGTITTASSATVPSGSVISQNPPSGTSAAVGSAVSLVVSTGPAAAGISVDATVFSDGAGTRTAVVTTTGANRRLLAFGASDGSSQGGQTLTVSGGGLSWTLVRRVNTRLGASEIWQALAATALSNASITLTQSQTGYRQSLTVVAFAGASGVGASATANGASGAPTVSLTTTQAGSLVYGVGNDYDRAVARTVPAGQAKIHEWVDTATGDTYWVQARVGAVSTAGTAVTLNDTAPTNDRWNFAIVEIVR
jgi:beta-lactam-binding protein with PASTA domain